MTLSKPCRIYATCSIGDEALQILRDKDCEVEVYPGPEAPSRQLILEKVATGIAGLITTLRDRIDAEIFEAGKGTLKVVSQFAVGFDNIDRAAANRYRIPFTNTPDVLTEATAEFAFFLMGDLARRLWSSERLVRENHWGAWHPFLPFLGEAVTGKTIAIVGVGRIGQAMARKCTGFDMNILCHNPGSNQNRDEAFAVAIQDLMDLRFARGLQRHKTTIRFIGLEEALAHADFVSLHVPLMRPEKSAHPTYHLINHKTLRKMKPSAFLINTSRGPVVDEAALAVALKERWIAGAALDVFEREPLPPESPLRDVEIEDRCRLFHHFASGTRSTRLSPDPEIGMAGRTVQGLLDVLEGNYGGNPRQMPFVVNKEAF